MPVTDQEELKSLWDSATSYQEELRNLWEESAPAKKEGFLKGISRCTRRNRISQSILGRRRSIGRFGV